MTIVNVSAVEPDKNIVDTAGEEVTTLLEQKISVTVGADVFVNDASATRSGFFLKG